jgi:DNA-binding response OmpR family regulator
LLGRLLWAQSATKGARRILIIDDDLEIRTMLEHTLRSAGYEVLLAANGRQGVRQYRATPASLVITDMFMPEKQGLETIIELRRNYPTVAIIAISGRPTANALLSIAKRLGAVEAIEKPFQPHELLTMVEEVLG